MPLKKVSIRAGGDAAGAARRQLIALLARAISRDYDKDSRSSQEQRSSKKN
jgi:hypothetical protein